jgi:hypothetical protein
VFNDSVFLFGFCLCFCANRLNSEASMNSFTRNGQDAGILGNGRNARGVNQSGTSKWPFTPVAPFPRSKSSQPGRYSGSGHDSGGAKGKGQLTRAAMLADVCLVVVWGATIPGLMWLGTLSGF